MKLGNNVNTWNLASVSAVLKVFFLWIIWNVSPPKRHQIEISNPELISRGLKKLPKEMILNFQAATTATKKSGGKWWTSILFGQGLNASGNNVVIADKGQFKISESNTCQNRGGVGWVGLGFFVWWVGIIEPLRMMFLYLFFQFLFCED